MHRGSSAGCPHPPASRRATSVVPGRAQVVKVERPTGRTTFATWARSGWLWCAAGLRIGGASRSRPGPGQVALAAGGRIRVVGPEALPARGNARVTAGRVGRDGRSGRGPGGAAAAGPPGVLSASAGRSWMRSDLPA